MISNYNYIIINDFINAILSKQDRKEYLDCEDKLYDYFKILLFIGSKGKNNNYGKSKKMILAAYDEYVRKNNQEIADKFIRSLNIDTMKSTEIKQLIDYYNAEAEENKGLLINIYILIDLKKIFIEKIEKERVEEIKKKK